MSLNRFAARVDSNQSMLIELARKLGMQVEIIKAPTDAIVCINGRLYWLEIKAPHMKGRKYEYTKAQHDFIERCALSGAPMLTWRTPEDVLACYEGGNVISYRDGKGM